ncbi:18267_t:CDS:2, partial [Funneliformis geosporum]
GQQLIKVIQGFEHEETGLENHKLFNVISVMNKSHILIHSSSKNKISKNGVTDNHRFDLLSSELKISAEEDARLVEPRELGVETRVELYLKTTIELKNDES